MSSVGRKLLVIQVAALGYDLLCDRGAADVAGLDFRPAEAIFPAVTSTAQATFRTAAPPSAHGIIANGLPFRAVSSAHGKRLPSAFTPSSSTQSGAS